MSRIRERSSRPGSTRSGRRAGDHDAECSPCAGRGGEKYPGECLGCAPWPSRGYDNAPHRASGEARSEEHTSELQSLMRISYAVFCLKKKKEPTHTINDNETQKARI